MLKIYEFCERSKNVRRRIHSEHFQWGMFGRSNSVQSGNGYNNSQFQWNRMENGNNYVLITHQHFPLRNWRILLFTHCVSCASSLIADWLVMRSFHLHNGRTENFNQIYRHATCKGFPLNYSVNVMECGIIRMLPKNNTKLLAMLLLCVAMDCFNIFFEFIVLIERKIDSTIVVFFLFSLFYFSF